MSQEKEIQRLTVEAEEYVVSMAILSPKAIDRMSALCKPWQFFDKSLGELWELLILLRESEDGVSVEKLRGEMVKRGVMERIGGVASFAKLLSKAPNPAHADYYAWEIVRYWGIRTVRLAAVQLLDSLDSSMVDPQAAVLEFQAKVDGVSSSQDAGFRHIREVAEKIVEKDGSVESDIAVSNSKITTGILGLDYVIDKLQPGKLYLLGGRTGKGKTALAANMASAAALSKKSVWFVSLEMGSEEIVQRILSSTSRVSANAWRRKLKGEEIDRVSGQIEVFRDSNLWFTEKGESFRTLKAKARLAKSLYGLDLIVIDNLQLIKPMNYRDPKHERMKALTEAFKNNFAKELGVAVLLLAQLSIEAEGDARPDNTCWADSKRIIDDADAAMILHRYEENNKEKTELLITKNRGGVNEAVIDLKWDGEYQSFEWIDPVSSEEQSGY